MHGAFKTTANQLVVLDLNDDGDDDDDDDDDAQNNHQRLRQNSVGLILEIHWMQEWNVRKTTGLWSLE